MEYIRVTTKSEGITQSQIMTEKDFHEWMAETPLWFRVMKNDIKYSFAKVKKSPLLKKSQT